MGERGDLRREEPSGGGRSQLLRKWTDLKHRASGICRPLSVHIVAYMCVHVCLSWDVLPIGIVEVALKSTYDDGNLFRFQ